MSKKIEEIEQQFIQFVDENLINFSLIVHDKFLNIPDGKSEDFEC